MTETGWIIVILVALVAIILLVALLRRKGSADIMSQEPLSEDLLPEQVPLTVSEPEPHANTSFPQEPLASIVPPIAEILDKAEEKPVPIDLSGALAENDQPFPVAPAAVEEPADEPAATDASPVLLDGVEQIVISTPPAPAPILAASISEGDDLLRLKGVGPKIVTLLKAEGVTRYAQIAAWTDTDIAAIDAKLGSFAGRPLRDNWVDQARLLAAGDVPGYEAKYGKL